MPITVGGGPMVVVSTAFFHARVRGLFPGLSSLKETKMFLPHSLLKLSREPPWPRGSVLDLRPLGFAFRIVCLEDNVISQSHHPQEVLLAQFSLHVHESGLKPGSFHFIFFNDCATNELSMRSCSWNVMLLINLLATWLIEAKSYYNRTKKNPTMCMAQSGLKPSAPNSVSATLRLAQQTQNICITFVPGRPNVFDVGPPLYKCYTNV